MLNGAIDITAALLFAYVILMWMREPLKPGKGGKLSNGEVDLAG